MNSMLNNLIDRFLYPDQIIFGHLLNPNIKSQHNYELTKSHPQSPTNDELTIYTKQMSKTKINSMIQMMSGNHPPLFKSSVLPKSTHYERNVDSQGQSSYSEEEDDYEDYDDQMYLMEKDYQGYFEDQYQLQENPLVSFGQNTGLLPRMKNYAKEFQYTPQYTQNKSHTKNKLHKFTKSAHTPTIHKQTGLGADLLLTKTDQQSQKISEKLSKIQNRENIQQNLNEGEQDWQTQSDEDQQQ